MKNRIFILALIAILWTSGVFASDVCPFSDEAYKTTVQKAILDYLSNPQGSVMEKDDIKSMVVFYLSNPDVSSADCSHNDIGEKARIADAKIPDSILTSVPPKTTARNCQECTDKTACGAKNSGGQTCNCLDTDGNGSTYEFCLLKPLSPRRATGCSACSDGTSCGETSTAGTQKCVCKDLVDNEGYEFCYLSQAAQTCAKCSDGTSCGSSNAAGKKCSCTDSNGDGKNEICKLTGIPSLTTSTSTTTTTTTTVSSSDTTSTSTTTTSTTTTTKICMTGQCLKWGVCHNSGYSYVEDQTRTYRCENGEWVMYGPTTTTTTTTSTTTTTTTQPNCMTGQCPKWGVCHNSGYSYVEDQTRTYRCENGEWVMYGPTTTSTTTTTLAGTKACSDGTPVNTCSTATPGKKCMNTAAGPMLISSSSCN